MELFAVIYGTAMMLISLLVPGTALSLALFPNQGNVERLATSLSLGVSPILLLYFLDKNFFVKITFESMAVATIALTLIGVITWRLRNTSKSPSSA
jgi:uncharacterized membrane protein